METDHIEAGTDYPSGTTILTLGDLLGSLFLIFSKYSVFVGFYLFIFLIFFCGIFLSLLMFACLFSFVCFDFICFVCICLTCSVLPVSPDCPFLITSSAFSNGYISIYILLSWECLHMHLSCVNFAIYLSSIFSNYVLKSLYNYSVYV